jgi:hypothetical protein
LITKLDTPADLIIRWLTNDPDNFNFAAKLVKEWTEEGTDFETILSDLDSYVTETLESAAPYSAARKAYESLSDEDMLWVDWSAILDKLTQE